MLNVIDPDSFIILVQSLEFRVCTMSPLSKLMRLIDMNHSPGWYRWCGHDRICYSLRTQEKKGTRG